MNRISRPRSTDRGAVAIWLAVLLIPLLVVAALAIDVAGMHTDRQRLQMGADAAALAIAQDCANGECGDIDATAEVLAGQNGPLGGEASADASLLDGENAVSVVNSSERDHWFAPVIGQDETTLSARSEATWNAFPTGGSHLPLAISWCEVVHWAQLDADDVISNGEDVIGLDIPDRTENVVLFSKGKKDNFHDCPDGTSPSGPNGAAPPGGFGWLVTDGPCRATTSADGWLASSTGRPTTCETLDSMIGQTVLVPIYDAVDDSGSNGEYRIFGYVAFTLEGYRNNKGSAGVVPSDCTSDADCIFGTIERFAATDADFESSPDGPQLGVTIVELRLPQEG